MLLAGPGPSALATPASGPALSKGDAHAGDPSTKTLLAPPSFDVKAASTEKHVLRVLRLKQSGTKGVIKWPAKTYQG